MVLTDVNALVYAHREDTPEHRSYRAGLESLGNGDGAYAVSSRVLSGFLRVVSPGGEAGGPISEPQANRTSSPKIRQPNNDGVERRDRNHVIVAVDAQRPPLRVAKLIGL